MTTPQWTADIEVDATLASALASDAFPEFGGRTCEAFGFGWDNTAWLLDGRALFRFPRRRAMASLLGREIAFLPAIAPLVPVPISAPRYVGEATDAFPWPFAGYDLLPGATACSRALTDDERHALAAPLGTFLRALHAIDPAPFVARGMPHDELGRLDHARRAKGTHDRVATIAASGVVNALEPFVAWLDAHPAPAPAIADGARRIVHGDLYARHLLLDENAALAGIIDWGDMHYGDPALDLAIAHGVLPASAHAVFRAAYGAIDERTWNAARYRAIYHALLELEYGIRENDRGMQRIGTDALALMRAAL